MLIGAIVVLGWVLGIAPKLAEVAVAESDLAGAVAQNAAYEVQGAAFKKQFENMDALKEELAAVQESVPLSPEIPRLIAELSSVADASGVVISSFTQNDAQAYDPIVAGVIPPVSDVPTDVADSAAATAPSTPAEPAGGLPAPVADSRITAANFTAIPVTVIVEGTAGAVLDFVSGLQKGVRLIVVNAISTAEPATETGLVTGTISGYAFVLADPPDASRPQ